MRRSPYLRLDDDDVMVDGVRLPMSLAQKLSEQRVEQKLSESEVPRAMKGCRG